MSNPTWVQGDTRPSITATLHDKDIPTLILDLTTATGIRFQMRKADDRVYQIDAAAAIVGSPTLGNVRYTWQVNDLSVPGDFETQWEVTFNDGGIQTTADTNTITVRRQ